MATSSFDRNVIIRKNNIKSLDEIVEKQYNKTVNLTQIRTIKLLKKDELKEYIGKGSSNE